MWLRLLGYEILGRNWHHRIGELDIIARRFGTLTVFEVKTLTRANGHLPADAVTAKKRRRIVELTRRYIARQRPWHRYLEFAIAEVILIPCPRIRLRRNAFRSEDTWWPQDDG